MTSGYVPSQPTAVATPTATPTLSPSGDYDRDRVVNSRDNCPYVYNPKQRDRNRNGIGDACEPRTATLATSALNLNGGSSDLLLSSSSTGSETKFMVETSGDLTEVGSSLDSPKSVQNVSFGDYDGDGVSDFATVAVRGGMLEWTIRNSSGVSPAPFMFGSRGAAPIRCDFDGDGKTDYALLAQDKGKKVSLLTRSADGLVSSVRIKSVSGLASVPYYACGAVEGEGASQSLAIITVDRLKRSKLKVYSLDGEVLLSKKLKGAIPAGLLVGDANVDDELSVPQVGVVRESKGIQKVQFYDLAGAMFELPIKSGKVVSSGPVLAASGEECDGVLTLDKGNKLAELNFCDMLPRSRGSLADSKLKPVAESQLRIPR